MKASSAAPVGVSTVSAPAVSVIMSVYNGARDMPAAVRSILDQSFSDFELIAIDNGSFKDDTRAVLNDLATADQRLRVVALDTNIGLAGALNHGIGLARGRYIARQDHDDISRPTRLAQQVAFLDANSRVGLLGTRAEIWMGDEPTERVHDHPTDNATLQFDLLANNPFVHSSVMLRRAALEKVGLYTTDAARQPPEDFELWSRIARHYDIANLPERLLVYREMPASMSREGANPFLDKLIVISAENLAHWNKMSNPDRHCLDAAALTHAAYDRISAETDIDVVCRLVETATAAIQTANPSVDLDARKTQVLANLRHHYGYARKVPAWTAPLAPTLHRLPIPIAIRRRIKAWISRR
jgi:cellulose synthase/poly-beta-1,6-N-acetylglucosamine synthase-like glycosyltransferase